ncbi:hypothetical protein JMJ06_002563 [Enterococcus faecalis]|nr:hypothetical protein [Enterococcus faecalis]
MNKGIEDIQEIQEILKKRTAKDISEGTGISLNSIKKLKSGERSIEKLNLKDAITLTQYSIKNKPADIIVWK